MNEVIDNPNYRVYLKHKDGSLSVLMHRGRTEWKLRTARKHRLNMVNKIVKNMELGIDCDVVYASLQLA